MKMVFGTEIQSRFESQDISPGSTVACNTETAAGEHKSHTEFLLTAKVQSNNQSEYLLVVGFATATIRTVR